MTSRLQTDMSHTILIDFLLPVHHLVIFKTPVVGLKWHLWHYLCRIAASQS